MARVKGGMMALKRRKNVLKRAKGYQYTSSHKEKYAHEALMRAGKYAFDHRKNKKRDFRELWIVRLNAAVRANGHQSYSTFINKLKKGGIQLDRKVLSTFASDHPEIFGRIATKVK